MDSKLVYPLAARYVRLEYYQSEQDAKRLADPKGKYQLAACYHDKNKPQDIWCWMNVQVYVWPLSKIRRPPFSF